MSLRDLDIFLEEVDGKPYFPPETVFQTYYALWLGQNYGSDPEVKSVLSSVAESLRDEYLEGYGDVVRTQLRKYYGRDRVDDDFNAKDINSDRFNVLDGLMKKTYRSDMRRRNKRWIMLTEYLDKLSQRNLSYMDMLLTMDRINNVVHNTGEVMLTKFENSKELLQAFNKAHHISDIKEFRSLANSVTLNRLARTLGEEEEL
jgi:hypothetical protein